MKNFCSKNDISFNAFEFKYQQKDPRGFTKFIEIIYAIKRANPDIIYIQTFDHIFISILFLTINRKITIIALHDVVFHSNTAFEWILKIARSIIMKHFLFFQVYSETEKKKFQQLYPDKSLFLMNFPLKDYGSEIKKALLPATNGNKLTFLFFGNILSYKGLKILINAINSLADEDYDTCNLRLVIAGRCSNWEEYKELIKYPDLIYSKIGFIGNDEVATLFTLSNYLVLPYLDATQSGPLKIAFNYNIPVIASDLESFKEDITDEVDGYLFKNNDVDDLKRVLRLIICNHENNYNILKKNQRNFVKNKYSTESIKESFNSMVFEVLKT